MEQTQTNVMASNGQIILFDIPSKPPRKTWSFNTWRTRMLLAYKGLDYRTEWLEYPEIRTRLEGHVPDNGTEAPYTVPTILLPDGTYVTNSRAIVPCLNERYPSTPQLQVQTPALEQFMPPAIEMMEAFRGVYIPGVMNTLLSDASVPFFRRTREKNVGMTMEELSAAHGGKVAYEGIQKGLREITELLGENTEGPFFGGREVAHVDFVWVGILLFMKRLGSEVFEEVMRRCPDPGRHEALLKAVEPWTERDD